MSSESVSKLGMAAYRAPSLFQPHRAREALRDAHAGRTPPLMGLYLGLSTVATARFIAPMGFDAVWVDWEHTSCNVETMTTMVHEIMFMSEGKTIPFVRVPGHDHAAIGFALDAGASIVIPQVETVAEAQYVVSSAKYGAKVRGTRSAPPFRLIMGLTDDCVDPSRSLYDNINDQAAIMIQIETLAAIHNLDAILTEVPDIDAVWLGTLDARVNMHLPANGGMGGQEKEWLDAVAVFDRTMEKHRHVAKAGFGFGERQKEMAKGKSFVAVAADVIALCGMMGELASSKENLPALVRGKEWVAKGETNGHANGNGVKDEQEVVANGHEKA
ncbi:hypothetical protein MMC13_004248 [Lambiella insularis]|nr:hypothetical protein [Lambiella insularis]